MSTPASAIANSASPKSLGFIERDDENSIAHDLIRPYFQDDHELFLLLAFDAMGRLVRMQQANSQSRLHCIIPPSLWRNILGTEVRSVIMAHNHPSGIAWPSGGDRQTTLRAAIMLDLLGIRLGDHLIFVRNGHYSFQRAGLL